MKEKRKRIFVCIFLLTQFGFFLTASNEAKNLGYTVPNNAQVVNTQCLNGVWQFALAKTEKEATTMENFYEKAFNRKKFSSIQVPSNWSILGFEEPVYRGFKNNKASEGFYYLEFTPKDIFDGNRVLLHFGGVWSSAEVWMNGSFVGSHFGGFSSFSFDISEFLIYDNVNTLAVRVKQTNRDYKFDTYDDWTLGGIYRDVVLEAMPKHRWIDDVTVQTKFDFYFEDADLIVKTLIGDNNTSRLPGNYPLPGENYQLQVSLTDQSGNMVANRRLNIASHTATDREIKTVFHIEKPKHWNAENPYLYDLRIDLLENNSIRHSRLERVGFREISTKGGVFRINGQAVKLRGVNRHDEHPDVGRATTYQYWLEDLKLMKEANINFIRLSHYTPAEGFVQLCDELGMYLGNEVSLGGASSDQMRDRSYVSSALTRSYETVVRDINSPSIIYWSIGNEDPLTHLHFISAKTVKGLDPTRPILIPWRYESWMPEVFDLLSVHYWQPNEYDRIAATSTRPIITTEYTHAYGDNSFGGLEARWKSLTQHASGAGGAIWMWADQGVKNPHPRPESMYSKINKDDKFLRIDDAGWDGIVDAYRNKTRDFWETKAVYAQVYPAVNQVVIRPKQSFTPIPVQNDFDFTNLDQVNIRWSIFEDEKKMDSGKGSIHGMPHAQAMFNLPTKAISETIEGKTYYVLLEFFHRDHEIQSKSVELIPAVYSKRNVSVNQKPIVKQEHGLVQVRCGEIAYVFNSFTGQMQSASLSGNQLINDLYPKIWREIQDSEASVIGRRNVRNAVDLRKYKSEVRKWDVEQSEQEVSVDAEVEYVVDEKNHFSVKYRYQINAVGDLSVYYEIYPKVVVPRLPVVGMCIGTTPALTDLKWFGLGPYDAYPNKRSAPRLGVWSEKDLGNEAYGNKATRWIEWSGLPGIVHIDHQGYMERTKTNPDEVNLYIEVLSKPEKGRSPDNTFPLLETTEDPFVGGFAIKIGKEG